MDAADLPMWGRAIAIYGPLGIFCLFAMWGSWKIARWFATEIIKPLFEKHLKLMDSLQMHSEASRSHMAQMESTSKSMTDTMANQAATVGRIEDQQEKIVNTQSKLAEQGEKVVKTQERLAESSEKTADTQQNICDTMAGIKELLKQGSDPGKPREVTCGTCQGTGKYQHKSCPTCGGAGKHPYPVPIR